MRQTQVSADFLLLLVLVRHCVELIDVFPRTPEIQTAFFSEAAEKFVCLFVCLLSFLFFVVVILHVIPR